MNDLENQLREALRRQDPSEGFAERVMAQIPHGRQSRAWSRQWLAVAAAACVAVVGVGSWNQHQREAQGEQAKQELIYALSVASNSLQLTKQMVTR